MKKITLIFGILLLVNLVSADTTTTTNVTVNNTAPVISTIYTYNSTTNTSLFDYTSNLTIKANVTDANGRADIDKILISFVDYSGDVIVNNASMNLTNITSGYTAEYNYSLNSSSTPGNYTITIFANDTAGNSTTNSTTIKVILTIQASVSAPSGLEGHTMEIYYNSTLIQTSSTDSDGRIYVKKGYDWYYIYYHPLAGYSTWEYITATTDYETVSITGTAGPGTGGGGGGGGGITPIPYEEAKEELSYFQFDLKFKQTWLEDNFINSLVTLKNVGDKAGDIILRYLIIQGNKIYNQRDEQVFVDSYKEGEECSTLNCPYQSKIKMPYGCWADTYLRVEALQLLDNSTTKRIAKTEQRVCKAPTKERGEEYLIPVKVPKKNYAPIILFFVVISGFVLLYFGINRF